MRAFCDFGNIVERDNLDLGRALICIDLGGRDREITHAAPTWKRVLPAPSGIGLPIDPPRHTVTRRGRVYIVGGDTVEVVARTPVLAPPDPTNIPLLPRFFPFLLPTTATATEPLLLSVRGGGGALAAWASTAWSPWKGRLGAMNLKRARLQMHNFESGLLPKEQLHLGV